MVLHECLTGLTPFDADTPMAFFSRKLDTRDGGDSRDARAAAVRPELLRAHDAADPLAPLWALVRRLVAAEPSERPASAREMLAVLDRMR